MRDLEYIKKNYLSFFNFPRIGKSFRYLYILSFLLCIVLSISFFLKQNDDRNNFLFNSITTLLYLNLLIICSLVIPIFFRSGLSIYYFGVLLFLQLSLIIVSQKLIYNENDTFQLNSYMSVIILQILNIQVALKLQLEIMK